MFFEDDIVLDNVIVKAIKSSHDAVDSRNFVIKCNGKKISLVTDTGYIKQKHFKDLYNSDLLLIESNHDIEMLQIGKYPEYLKNRIWSDYGHLSNHQTGFYLTKIMGDNTKQIVLLHLSHENNSEEKALETVNGFLKEYNIECGNVCCARQDEISEVFIID